jgi:hypothetical protein
LRRALDILFRVARIAPGEIVDSSRATNNLLEIGAITAPIGAPGFHHAPLVFHGVIQVILGITVYAVSVPREPFSREVRLGIHIGLDVETMLTVIDDDVPIKVSR